MGRVPGTWGYDNIVERFVEMNQALNFEETSKHFLEFVPSIPGRVVDAGSGIGQNAAAHAWRGHSVVAADPVSAFLSEADSTYMGLGGRFPSCKLAESLDEQTGCDLDAHGFQEAENSRQGYARPDRTVRDQPGTRLESERS